MVLLSSLKLEVGYVLRIVLKLHILYHFSKLSYRGELLAIGLQIAWVLGIILKEISDNYLERLG